MNKELKENELLLGRAEVVLTTEFFGRPIRWKLSKMTLRKMLQMSEIYNKIEVDDKILEESPDQLAYQYEAVRKNAKLVAEVIAVAVKSRLPKWILKWYFFRTINSGELQDFVVRVLKESNYANFTTSIFLLNSNRITKPKRIEEESQA